MSKILTLDQILGVDGGVSLVLKPNIPRNVECFGLLTPYTFGDYCNELLATISASPSPLHTFGPEGSPGVDQKLPNIRRSLRKY